MKKNIVFLGVALLAAAGLVWYLTSNFKGIETLPPDGQPAPMETPEEETAPEETAEDVLTPPSADETAAESESKEKTIIGKSVQGRDVVAYHFGAGEKEILFVGGTHGGYSWNTALLAYQLIDYLRANPQAVPAGVRATVIPALNPDGLAKVVDKDGPFSAADVSATANKSMARFNANNVDLNRNFDCEWKAQGVWQNKSVSGGSAPFSEAESAAIRDLAQNKKPAAVVAWYASAGGVFASNCKNGVLPETQTIVNLYANASGYPARQDFDFYEISGDMTNWFAKIGVPAIGVVLTGANDTEWSKNWAGVKSILDHYGK